MQPLPLYLLILVIICFPIGAWLALIRRANKKDEKVISETEHLLPKDISEPIFSLIKRMEGNKAYFSLEVKYHEGYKENIPTFYFYDPAKDYRFELYNRSWSSRNLAIVPDGLCDWMTRDEMTAIWRAAENLIKNQAIKKRNAKRQSVVDMYTTKEK